MAFQSSHDNITITLIDLEGNKSGLPLTLGRCCEILPTVQKDCACIHSSHYIRRPVGIVSVTSPMPIVSSAPTAQSRQQPNASKMCSRTSYRKSSGLLLGFGSLPSPSEHTAKPYQVSLCRRIHALAYRSS
jgi:hypothetical protein